MGGRWRIGLSQSGRGVGQKGKRSIARENREHVSKEQGSGGGGKLQNNWSLLRVRHWRGAPGSNNDANGGAVRSTGIESRTSLDSAKQGEEGPGEDLQENS